MNGNAGTILILPKEENSNVFVQLKSCKSHSDPIAYINYNAFTKEQLNSGKIYQTDQIGIYYITQNSYLENEIQLTGESGVTIYSKHTGIDKSYSPKLELDYGVTFDSSGNTATIKKPIFDEEFTITVLVGPIFFRINFPI